MRMLLRVRIYNVSLLCCFRLVTPAILSSATFGSSLSLSRDHPGTLRARHLGGSALCLSTCSKNDDSHSMTKALSVLYEDNRGIRIQMPTHPHGYRIFPFDWKELQDIVPRDLSLLCRSVEHQYQYEAYKLYLKKEWASVNDHILCSKFGVPAKVDVETGLRKAMDPDKLPRDFPKLSLLPNEFPYYVQEPIQHWVLWKLGDLCGDGDVEWAKNELKERLGTIHSFIHWINPPHLKSIPDVDHVHILCLPENENAADELANVVNIDHSQ